MTMLQIPICACHHPLDAHDPKTGKCIGLSAGGCSCHSFTDSGRKERVDVVVPALDRR